MAARELMRNGATRYCVFYIDTSADLALLPNSKEYGKGELILSSSCAIGSIARDMEGKHYTLNGEDKWTPYEISSGGQVSIQTATDDETNSMLDDVLI